MIKQDRAVFTDEQWKQIQTRLKLPPRQEQVVRELFNGRSDKQIAEVLGVALPTVRSHLRRIYLKFDVQDRTELVLYIVREFIDLNGINHKEQKQRESQEEQAVALDAC
ncbi:MAG: hypothetical protein Kow00105_09440 [Phycisphaeraceae bacterium]